MNKLTNSEIAKVFGMYLPNKPRVLFDGILVGYVWGLYSSTGNVFIEHNHACVRVYHHCSKVKLYLTPLSKITDEHAIEVAKIIGWNEEDAGKFPIPPGTGISIMGKEFAKNLLDGVLTRKIIYSVNVFQHLISRDYAVPLWFGLDHWANNKTAIDLGLAIEK